MAERAPLLVARAVSKTYRRGSGGVRALRDVDLVIPAGAHLAVTGPSGSGKTTLLHCLAGLEPVDGGTVTFDGRDLATLSDRQRAALRAQRMGFVFQSRNLLPVLTAAENVEVPLLVGGTPPSEAARRAAAALERVGMAARRAHRPGELSGGEQQRVAIARAVVARPALLWADEPTGALDSTTATAILELFDELHADGVTLVVVTHDPAVTERAQRRIVLHDGQVRADTAPRGNRETAPGRRRRAAQLT